MRRVLFFVLAAAAALIAQDDLNSLKAAFGQRIDESLLQRLVNYHDSIPEDSSFETDYMIAVTLSDLAEFQSTACPYVQSMEFTYRSPYYFEGRQVALDPISKRTCPPPPPSAPGVKTVFELKIPRKAALLSNVRQQLGKKAAMSTAVSQPSPADGVYSMVHDGWKGELVLRGRLGEYISADRTRLAVRVISFDSGYHIVFVVLGLGGENADGLGGQKFDGYLMTQTHDGMAGVTWWQGHPFGFYAIKR